MKVHIKVVDDNGKAFEGTAELAASSGASKRESKKPTAKVKQSGAPSFSLNARAFMNKYAKGLSGSQKFTLLVAHIAKGKPGHAISVEQITTEWNRMKGVTGSAFNRAHATRAKEYGWIDSPKRSFYALSDTWKEAIGTD